MYPWKRFWVKRDGVLRYDADGFLADPEGESGDAPNPDAHPLEAFESNPCLALLGEAGLGKSTTLMDPQQVSMSDGRAQLWLDLKSYGSEDRLRRDLFATPAVESWKRSDQLLWVFLDSLDECLIQNHTLKTPGTMRASKAGGKQGPGSASRAKRSVGRGPQGAPRC